MDRIGIILLGVLYLSAAGVAVADEPGAFASNSWYAAPACGAPCGFGSVPGCCECPCHPCDNAWAGYCERKACKQAIWARFGAPKPPSGRCNRPVVVGASFGRAVIWEPNPGETIVDEAVAPPEAGPNDRRAAPANPMPAGGVPRIDPLPEPPPPVIEKSTRTWLPWR